MNRWNLAQGVGLDRIWPSDDQRDACAALVETTFATAERSVVGDTTGVLDPFAGITTDPTVVGGEDDHRVFREFEFIESRQDPSDALVDRGDHGGIGWIAVALSRWFVFEMSD